MKYILVITFSDFGTREKIYKNFSKNNREIIIEQVDDEDTDEHHVSGVLVDIITCKSSSKKDIATEVEKFIEDNSLFQQCFGIYKKDDYSKEKELYTEENLFDNN